MDEELVLDADGWPDPWPAVIELAWAVDSAHWALIGGLMVQLHCRLRGVEPHRATRDIDAMTRVETTWRGSLDHLLTGLRGLGYDVVTPAGRDVPVHRLRRGTRETGDQVDFLIPDHVPPAAVAGLPRPTPVQAPGGRNARDRLLQVTLQREGGGVQIATPDLVGALGLKIEAYTADSRDRERHLQDAVSLARLLAPGDLDRPLHGSAPTRLRRFLRRLEDHVALGQAGISRDDAADAALAVEELLHLHAEGG